MCSWALASGSGRLRLAYVVGQAGEHVTQGGDDLVVLGIPSRGVALAERLAAALEDVDVVVTDDGIRAADRSAIEAAGVEVVVA